MAEDKQFHMNLQRFIESRLIMGVSPTGNKNTTPLEKGTSNKGKYYIRQFIQKFFLLIELDFKILEL